MAQGDGHCVRRVVRPRNGAECQKPPGHLHNLPLFRFSITRHRELNFRRAVLKDRHGLPLRLGQNDAPRLGHADAGGHVVVEIELLHRHGIRLEHSQQFAHIVGYLQQSGWQRLSGGGGDGPAPDQARSPPLCLQNPESHNGKARVDP